jgi:hypothetical protein
MNLDLRASGLLALLLIVLATCAVFGPSIATAQEPGPITLTEKQVQNFIAAHQEMAKLYAGLDPDKPDPKLEAWAEAIAKSLAEHAAVTMNIEIIMAGIDPKTKTFTEPPEQIRQEIAKLRADKSVPEAQKKQILSQLDKALRTQSLFSSRKPSRW